MCVRRAGRSFQALRFQAVWSCFSLIDKALTSYSSKPFTHDCARALSHTRARATTTGSNPASLSHTQNPGNPESLRQTQEFYAPKHAEGTLLTPRRPKGIKQREAPSSPYTATTVKGSQNIIQVLNPPVFNTIKLF